MFLSLSCGNRRERIGYNTDVILLFGNNDILDEINILNKISIKFIYLLKVYNRNKSKQNVI